MPLTEHQRKIAQQLRQDAQIPSDVCDIVEAAFRVRNAKSPSSFESVAEPLDLLVRACDKLAG